MWWTCLISLATASEPTWFYPNASDARVVLADGRAGALPVERTGDVVLWAADPDAVLQHDQVRSHRVLGDDGHLLVISARGDEVALSRELHERDDVRWAHPDFRIAMRVHELPDDPLLEDQWHLDNTGQSGGTEGADVRAFDAWALSTGAGQLIAVFDSGVDSSHPDLLVTLGTDFADGDTDSNPDVEESSAGHGTAVAGLAAAIGDNGLGVAGVAYDAEIYAVRIIGAGSVSDINTAFREAVDAGATVLNNSWGYGDGCEAYETYGALSNAVGYAERSGRDGLGSVVVFSAGNDACDASEDGILVMEEVVAVAALDDDDERESYSSWGEVVDIAAPAGGLVTTDISGDEGYGPYGTDEDYTGTFNGTSAAAPVVSGVFALVLASNDRITAAQARELVCQTASRNDLDGAEWDEDGRSLYYGCGRIDAYAAVAAAANAGPPGIPTLLRPSGTVLQADAAVLEWTAEDPDGDALTYALRLWVDGERTDHVLTEPRFDLTDLVSPGQTVEIKLTAADPWGEGEGSEKWVFTVLPGVLTPAAPVVSGCGAVTGPAWLALLPLWLRRRRRS